MGTERHRVQRQRFRVTVDSEAVAMTLHSHLSALNRTVLLDTIERVLDEYAIPARHIRISRLGVDLGVIPMGPNLAREANARLERELRRALETSFRELASQPSPDRYAQTAEEARLGLLDQYLTRGTLPFWTTASEFDLDAMVAQAATETPDALITLLRHHRDDEVVIQRLVRQLRDAGLRPLLGLLDPANGTRVAREIEESLGEQERSGAQVERDAHSERTPAERRFATWVRALTDAVHQGATAVASAAVFPHVTETAVVVGGATDDEAPPGDSSAWQKYDYADALRYYLRSGVLPWTAALAGGARGDAVPTVRTLLDALPGFSLTLLRSIFPSSPAQRFAAALKVVQLMSDETRARLVIALSTSSPGGRPTLDRDPAAAASGSDAVFARAILRMLDGEEERWDATVDSARRLGFEEPLAGAWNVALIKSVLAQRATRGWRAEPTQPSSATLLQILMEEHPADARHFFKVLRAAGISPAALLSQPVSPRLFQSSMATMPAPVGRVIPLLLRLVSRLPEPEQPGDTDAIRSAVTGAVLDDVSVTASTDTDVHRRRLAAAVLRALFGSRIGAAHVQHLLEEADRLVRAGECVAEDLAVVHAALDAARGATSAYDLASSTEAVSASALAQEVERLPAAAARRVTRLLGIVSSWPAVDRPSSEQTMFTAVAQALRQQAGADPLAASFIAVVLRALLGSHIAAGTVGRLLSNVSDLAGRGELSSTDVEAIREAAATVTRESSPEPLAAERIVTVLTERAQGQRRARPEYPASPTLLHILIEQFPSEARAFLQRMHALGIRPSTMLAGAAAQRLLDPSVELLRPLERRVVALLLRIVSALPSDQQLLDDGATRSTLAGVVLDHAADPTGGERIVLAALRALFGPTLPAAVRRRLIADAERLARAGEFGPEAVTVMLHVLGPVENMPLIDDSAPAEIEATALAGRRAPEPQARRDTLEAAAPETAVTFEAHAEHGPAKRPAVTPVEASAALARLRVREDALAHTPSGVDQSVAAPVERAHFTKTDDGWPAGAARLSDDALRHILQELVVTAPETVRDVVGETVADVRARERWVRILSESELARITCLLEPAHHKVLIAAAELLFAAWDSIASQRGRAPAARAALWSFLLEFFSRHPQGERADDVLVRDFFAPIQDQSTDSDPSSDRGGMRERVRLEAVRLAERAGNARLRAVLSEHRPDVTSGAKAQGTAPHARSTAHPPAPRQRTAFRMNDDEPEAGGEPVHITNAGLVIVGAFLPQLFERLAVLEEAPGGGRRLRADAVSRTVHMLQYLVDGRTDTPEPRLCLNKVLCGVPLDLPVDREIEMTPRERELCDTLLAAVVANWTIISNTSVAGLRETFLQRDGRLDHPSTGWRLRVQRKTLDVLLDHISWTVSTIAHSWMPEPLFVAW
jgi:contractile injection system tape measure protein